MNISINCAKEFTTPLFVFLEHESVKVYIVKITVAALNFSDHHIKF
jgi:hypothetical protein